VHRYSSALGIAAAGIVLSVMIFTTMRGLESKNAEASFNGVAQEHLDALETNITLALDNLVAIGALFDHADDVTRRQFGLFTSPLLARTQAVQALEWIPRVPSRERAIWEKRACDDGFPSFQFTERASAGRLMRAGGRDEYFPVFYVAPFRGNEKALGYDLASDPVRRAALRDAADSGQLAATGRIVLVQETGNQYGFLVFRPVYKGGLVPETTEARREALVGFTLAVFRVADIVRKSGVVSSAASVLNLAIFDIDANAGERLLYPKGAHLDGVEDLPRGFQATRIISVGGRQWELAAYPLANNFRPARWSSWAALLSGLLLTSLLTTHLAERKRAEHSLRQSEERARLLFATIPHPSFVFDITTLEFLEVNDAAIQRYGYSRDEFLRMKITEIGTSEEVQGLRRRRQDRSAQGAGEQWKHRTKDGRTIEVEIYSHRLKYGTHRAGLVIAQNVTERNRLEIDLRNAQKLEAVGRLAAGVAHEINTPIQFIGDNTHFLRDAFASFTQLLEGYHRLHDQAARGGWDQALANEVGETEKAVDIGYLLEEVPKAIAQSLDGVARVATLVSAMKEFAHPDQKDAAAADINAALRSTLTVARNELKYVADVETDFAELPMLTCNIGEVNQVFLNLLINAAHAVGEAKKDTESKGLIGVCTSPEPNGVLISISDTGCGIPENIRDRIFDPFFTTKEVGRGTGQGLAIARSVVERHGGTITFTSEVGKGTTFYVRLPWVNPVKDTASTSSDHSSEDQQGLAAAASSTGTVASED
jgi:two-component system, NtrC family, sensor kinase